MEMHMQQVKAWKGLISSEWTHVDTLQVIGWQPTK